MINEERTRVLRMVADGKVTAEEAADLLEALERAQRPEVPRPLSPPELSSVPRAPSKRSLIIRIEGQDGSSKVHLRIPLGLARAAGRFIPRPAQSRLAEHGIDLEQLIEDMGSVSVEGPLLQIEDETDKVLIAVE